MSDEPRRRGVKVTVMGTELVFVPIRCGEIDDPKREALMQVQAFLEGHDMGPLTMEVQHELAQHTMNLARSLLDANYEGKELDGILEEIPVGFAPALISIAQFGRVPENFTIG